MKILTNLTIFLSIAFSLYGQNDLIEVQSMVDTAEIYIGDQINYSLVIKHDKDLRIEQPGEGLHLGMFEIKEFDFSEPIEQDGFITQRYDFTISVFDTGSFTIPAFPIAYFPDTTNQYKIIEAAPIDIYVNSLLSGEDAPELKDIKPPIDFPFDFMFLYTIIALVAVLATVGYIAYRKWKSKKETGFLFSAPPKARPAHEVALGALKELYNSELLANEEYKLFFSKLSEIIRIYLEGRFFVSALEETTYEILHDIKSHLDEKNFIQLTFILEQSDLVKFAKYIPDNKTIDKLKIETEQFIHDTKIILKEENTNLQEAEIATAEKSIQQNIQEEKGD
jgi:hypothetical protein